MSKYFSLPDVDDCQANPCLNDGKCVDGVKTNKCSCVHGFRGANCEISMPDFFYSATSICTISNRIIKVITSYILQMMMIVRSIHATMVEPVSMVLPHTLVYALKDLKETTVKSVSNDTLLIRGSNDIQFNYFGATTTLF